MLVRHRGVMTHLRVPAAPAQCFMSLKMETDQTDGFADISQDENSDAEETLSYPYKARGSKDRSGSNESGNVSENDSEETEISLDSETVSNVSDSTENLQLSRNTRPRPNVTSANANGTNYNHRSKSESDVKGPSKASNFHRKQSRKADIRINLIDNERRDSSSTLDGLLCEIYDRCHPAGISRYSGSADSDGFTEYSSNSEGAYLSSKGDSFQESTRIPRALLQAKGENELRAMIKELKHGVSVYSGRLVKQLKRRDHNLARLQKNQDVLTAILQAVSQKRREDAQLRFSIEPHPGKKSFRQWYDALRSMARLPFGVPPEFRKKMWLSLADWHVRHLKVDWQKTVRLAFNDRTNPDDDKLGSQIVKDLHRTGCSGFCGQGAEDDRVVLKRVLLAYARWNKSVGYCQGFNVIAALILEVMDRIEDDAFKVMIFLIDHVLPDNYFTNNLRALSVDMAVFRELLHFKMPVLADHLDKLQKAANDCESGSYEPPLTNVFTMQWFLTLFATCLPKSLVLRVWDTLFLEGSEILLRTALAIWLKLEKRLMHVQSADEFYSRMGNLTNKMLRGQILDQDDLIQTIYTMAPFPFPHLNEIREKYMFSITPFSPLGSLDKSEKESEPSSIKKDKGRQSDEEVDFDEDELQAMTCFTGFFPMPISPQRARIEMGDRNNVSNDITSVSPGAFGATSDDLSSQQSAAMLERMNLDIQSLKKQYWRIQRKQMRAHVVYAPGSKSHSRSSASGGKQRQKKKTPVAAAAIDSPAVINHLLIGKHGLGDKNAKVTLGPQIAPPQIQNYDHEEKRRNRTHINVKPNVTKTPKSFNGQRTKPKSKIIPVEQDSNWLPPSKDQLVLAERGQQIERQRSWPPPSKDQLVIAERNQNLSRVDEGSTSAKKYQKNKSKSEDKADKIKVPSSKDWEDIDLSESDSGPDSPDLIDFGEGKNKSRQDVKQLNSDRDPNLEGAVVNAETENWSRTSSRQSDTGSPSTVTNAFAESVEESTDHISSISELEQETDVSKKMNDLTTDFNFSFEAFKPETPETKEAPVSLVQNGNCVGSKKPWLGRSQNKEGVNDHSGHSVPTNSLGRYRSSSMSSESASPTSPPGEVFNPFPVRKIKGNEQSVKRKAKLGLMQIN